MRNLITGGSGFLGRWLIRHFQQERPSEVVMSLGRDDGTGLGVKHFTCDMNLPGAIRDCLQVVKPDRIFHLAGSARIASGFGVPGYFENNYLTTLSLLQAIERFDYKVSLFFASSVHVYGNTMEAIDESSPVCPNGAYGFTKYLAEEAIRHFVQRREGLSAVVGRLYTCIGPEQSPGFVASDLCRKIASLPEKGGVLRTGPLSSYRRFSDVRDIVRLLPRLLDVPLPSRYEVVNIASPHELRVEDMLKLLLRLSGKQPTIQSEERGNANPFLGLRLNVEKLMRWVPDTAFRPIEATLSDMLDWQYRQG